jgi:hypothetical protein
MDLHKAVQLVVADQRYQRQRTIGALAAIKHVRGNYDHDNVHARCNEGSITDRPTAQAYHAVVDADGYELSMLFAAWEPKQARPGFSLWAVLPVVVIAIVVLTALLS